MELEEQASRGQHLAIADDVIDNSGLPEALDGQVDALHRRYVEVAELHAADAGLAGYSDSP